MGKQPAFQFYPGDWLRDSAVQSASWETRGVWIELLLRMWDSPERGELSLTNEQYCRLLGIENDRWLAVLGELETLRICYAVTDGNEKVTIRNRRMYREQKQRTEGAERARRFREKHKNNAIVTPPSSSSSSSSCTKVHNSLVEKEIFDYWNSMENLITHREFTNAFSSCIHSQLKTYTCGEICDAIESYDDILGDPTYLLEYKWKIDEFLRRKLEQFVADANPHDFQPKKSGGKK